MFIPLCLPKKYTTGENIKGKNVATIRKYEDESAIYILVPRIPLQKRHGLLLYIIRLVIITNEIKCERNPSF